MTSHSDPYLPSLGDEIRWGGCQFPRANNLVFRCHHCGHVQQVAPVSTCVPVLSHQHVIDGQIVTVAFDMIWPRSAS